MTSVEIQLTDGSVVLRPLQARDIGPMYQAVRESITEVSRWLAWCHPDYSVEDSTTWIESRPAAWASGTEYSFAITDAADDTFLGTCGLNRIDPIHRWANLGYWVRSSRTRKGVATAATLLVARFALEELKLNRVEIVIADSNAASLRVAEKVGATREGLLRRKVMAHGEVHDAVMFSLIWQDFERLGRDGSTD
jgi:ribosomal-protein-serine acetyltransferase